MKKNDIYEITIEDIGSEGEGIGHIIEDGADAGQMCGIGADEGDFDNLEHMNRGIAVFVKDAVIGDVAKVKLIKVKKNYAYGRLEEIITPSPYRVEPPCPKARSCGGCSIMHMSYDKQLEYKWNKVKNCLERIGGIENVADIMEPIYGMENPYNYRNKMQFPVGLDKKGNVQIGFYAGRTHSIIDLEKCYIGHPVNDFIVEELRPWLAKWQKKTGSFIYDEEKHCGLVRHILTRVGFTTGQLMVCLIINGKKLPCENSELVEVLGRAVERYNEWVDVKIDVDGKLGECDTNSCDTGKYGDDYIADEQGTAGVICSCDSKKSELRKVSLESVSININREKTNKILGDKCVTLHGKSYINDFIGDVQFCISPMSFYQVNPAQTKVLYDKAVEYADLTGNDVVWDMYCGIGTISLSLAKKAGKVYGVEIVPQAIEDAKNNAKINGFENTEFFCGKAEEVVPGFYGRNVCNRAVFSEAGESQAMTSGVGKVMGESDGAHPDVIVVDPPRKGCDSVLLDTIEAMAPKRLVYVSCDPATLARDVKILVGKGFKLEKVAVVDQFGHSGHVECVTLLQRKNT